MSEYFFPKAKSDIDLQEEEEKQTIDDAYLSSSSEDLDWTEVD